MESIWGNFEGIGEPKAAENKTDEEIAAEEAAAEEAKVAQEEADKAKAEEDKGKSDEELEAEAAAAEEARLAEEEKNKEKGAPAEEAPEEDDLVSTFDNISTVLEDEDLMYIDESKQYAGTAEGFAEMMKDNLTAQEESFKDKMAKLEADIRAEYAKQTPSIADLDVENEDHAMAMLNEYYTDQGLEPDEVKEKIAELKDLDYLSKEAKIAKRVLVKKEAKTKEDAQKIEADKIAAKQKEVDDYVADMKKAIDDTEEIAGFKLTKKLTQDFKDYCFKADKDGKTQAQKAGKDPKRRIRLAFLDYIDFNKKDFEVKAKTAVAADFKKKNSRFTSKQSTSKGKTVVPKENKEFSGSVLSGSMWGSGDED